MNIPKKIQYILFLIIPIFLFPLSKGNSDELGIFIGAVSKHYCTCIFVSELQPDRCSDALNNLMAPVLEDSGLASAANQMDVDIDAGKLVVSVSIGDRGVKSVFNGKKGCYLDKIN